MSEQTAEAHADAIREEYGKYEAIQDIPLNGVPAFHKGDRVPAGHVDGYRRPEVVDGEPTGKQEHIKPVVHPDYVKKVTAKQAAAHPVVPNKES